MSNTYQIYLISDSTGETLDRIFIAIKAQFKNNDYKINILIHLLELKIKFLKFYLRQKKMIIQ